MKPSQDEVKMNILPIGIVRHLIRATHIGLYTVYVYPVCCSSEMQAMHSNVELRASRVSLQSEPSLKAIKTDVRDAMMGMTSVWRLMYVQIGLNELFFPVSVQSSLTVNTIVRTNKIISNTRLLLHTSTALHWTAPNN